MPSQVIDDAKNWRGWISAACGSLFNGAEPVHASTLEEFAARFARFGLRREAPPAPVYGLAEALCRPLRPECSPPGRGPLIDLVARAEFTDRARRAVPAAPDNCDVFAVRGVRAGTPRPPRPGRGRFNRESSSVPGGRAASSSGAPRPPEGTSATAGATDELLRGGWLDTGDPRLPRQRGAVRLTGRIKDLVIRAGHNLHPEELEQT